jgi:hypothetical protein
MRIAIVTGDEPHHKHLCVRLAEKFNLVGPLYPPELIGPRRLVHRTIENLLWGNLV